MHKKDEDESKISLIHPHSAMEKLPSVDEMLHSNHQWFLLSIDFV